MGDDSDESRVSFSFSNVTALYSSRAQEKTEDKPQGLLQQTHQQQQQQPAPPPPPDLPQQEQQLQRVSVSSSAQSVDVNALINEAFEDYNPSESGADDHGTKDGKSKSTSHSSGDRSTDNDRSEPRSRRDSRETDDGDKEDRKKTEKKSSDHEEDSRSESRDESKDDTGDDEKGESKTHNSSTTQETDEGDVPPPPPPPVVIDRAQSIRNINNLRSASNPAAEKKEKKKPLKKEEDAEEPCLDDAGPRRNSTLPLPRTGSILVRKSSFKKVDPSDASTNLQRRQSFRNADGTVLGRRASFVDRPTDQVDPTLPAAQQQQQQQQQPVQNYAPNGATGQPQTGGSQPSQVPLQTGMTPAPQPYSQMPNGMPLQQQQQQQQQQTFVNYASGQNAPPPSNGVAPYPGQAPQYLPLVNAAGADSVGYQQQPQRPQQQWQPAQAPFAPPPQQQQQQQQRMPNSAPSPRNIQSHPPQQSSNLGGKKLSLKALKKNPAPSPQAPKTQSSAHNTKKDKKGHKRPSQHTLSRKNSHGPPAQEAVSKDQMLTRLNSKHNVNRNNSAPHPPSYSSPLPEGNVSRSNSGLLQPNQPPKRRPISANGTLRLDPLPPQHYQQMPPIQTTAIAQPQQQQPPPPFGGAPFGAPPFSGPPQGYDNNGNYYTGQAQPAVLPQIPPVMYTQDGRPIPLMPMQ